MNAKRFVSYFINELIGRFTGFIIGMWASSLVAIFFEKRGIHNLWGITAKRKVLDKDTFEHIEWFASVIIGFIVYEIISRFIKEKLVPRIKAFSEEHQLEQKSKAYVKEKVDAALNPLRKKYSEDSEKD